MSCEWVAAHMDDYELGLLGAEDRAHLEAHLARCEACRALLASARSADARIRAALAWAEPPASFAAGVAARARRPARWPWAAAAAAVLCAVAIYGTTRPRTALVVRDPEEPVQRVARPVEEPLITGRLRDAYGLPVERLKSGRTYVAAAHTAIDTPRGSFFVLARGTRFEAGPEEELAMSVHSGTVFGQVGRSDKELTVELAPELGGAIVRTTGCQFYSSGAPPHWLAHAATDEWPADIRVHVYSGRLVIDLGAQKLELAQGDSAIISGGVSAGSTSAVEARIRELRVAIGADEQARRRRYRRLCAHYARRLLELRAAGEGEAPSYLPERTALVDELLRTHARTLGRLEAEIPEFLELEAAEAELERLDFLRIRAEDALKRVLASIGESG